MKLNQIINSKKWFLTDSGFETTMIFNHHIDLPHFALFPLIDKPKYQKVIYNYYKEHLEIAKENNAGFILESATWRANKDWGYKLGYNENELIKLNKLAIEQLKSIKNEYENQIQHILISGQIGPARDGYVVKDKMNSEESKNYHSLQVSAFKEAGSDLTTALTMCYIDEALGIVMSAKEYELPVVISFTVETDGKLPSGETLKEAIETIDQATHSYPIYYMINCAHPSHFIKEFETSEEWKLRIKGIRANASCKSHAELDEAEELDKGDLKDFGKWHQILKTKLPNLRILGGCCGTDVSHVSEICDNIKSTVTA